MKSLRRFILSNIVGLTFITVGSLHAQWVQTHGPYGGSVYPLAVSPNGAGGTDVFAGTTAGLFRSTDDGMNWTSIGLQNYGVNAIAFSSDRAGSTNIFAATYSGIFLSTDDGSSWTAVNNGLTNTWVYSVAAFDSVLYAGTNAGVFLSTNNGSIWSPANSGLSNTPVFSIAFLDSVTFAGTSKGAFRSTDDGTTWTQLPLVRADIWAFASSDTNLFAGTDSGLYISSDSGKDWHQTALKDSDVDAILVGGTDIYAGAYGGGIYRSTDKGITWNQIDSGLSSALVNSLVYSGTRLIAGTVGGGIFISSDAGDSWTASNTGFTNGEVYAVLPLKEKLLAGTSLGVFLSGDQGAIWTSIGLTNDTVFALAIHDSNLYAGTSRGAFVSSDSGTNWHSTGLTASNVESFAFSDTDLFASSYGEGIFRSTDKGITWARVDTGLATLYVRAVVVFDTILFAGTGTSVLGGGVYISTNNGASWTQTSMGNYPVYSLFIFGTDIYAGTSVGIYLSSDTGKTWIPIATPSSSPPGFSPVSCFYRYGPNLFAATRGDGIFLSSDGGTDWSDIGDGLTNHVIRSVSVLDSDIFAGTVGGGVWRRPLSEMVTGIQHSPSIPARFVLYQNYPNPFNPSTTIRYQLSMNSFVTLKIYDVLGREVRRLIGERQPAGMHTLTFDAANLPSGVYFYRLSAGSFMQTKKLVLLK
jgi:Secretion system C-terminal sorting domain